MGLNKHWLPVFIALVALFSCKEDLEVFVNDPTLEVRFINADSLVVLNDSLVVLNDTLTMVTDSSTIVSDSIQVLSDSIVVLDELIANGNSDLAAIRETLAASQTALTSVSAEIDLVSDGVTTRITSVEAIISLINQGNVLVNFISGSEDDSVLTYTDSASTYNLPMSMIADQSAYQIDINGIVYSLSLNYQREETVDEKRRLRILVSNIAVESTSFDSTSCKSSNCENETPLLLYF